MPQFRKDASITQAPEEDAADVRAARDDPRAFARLYDRYVQPVYRYLRSRVGSAEEAEELTSQTFLAAMESLPRYDHRGYFSAWLFSIARRKAADLFRRRINAPLEEAEEIAAESDLPGETARADQTQKLARLIRSLVEEERELIRLHFTAGLTYAEMGVLLGKKEDAVKKSMYRLLERLHGRME
ncbi:MAG: sigma-70 family RNA polymerase sigma factor [Anaerolineales bacterium]